MTVHLNAPCSNCPFLKKGGIRLMHDRILEITAASMFPCHKTTKKNSDGRLSEHKGSAQCGGFLIFNENCGTPTQMMRIGERLGMYDPSLQKPKDRKRVFADLDAMLETALDEQ